MKRALPFLQMEYAARIQKVRTLMAERGIDLLLLVSPVTINYLTGCLSRGPKYFALPRESEPAILAFQLERPLVLYSSWLDHCETFETGENEFQAARRWLERRGLLKGTIGVEWDSHHVSAETVSALVGALAGSEVVDGSGIVKRVMQTKSPQEIAYIRTAGTLSAKGMAAAVDAIKPGVTDNEVAAEAYHAMMAAGSEWLCSQPYVTTGARSGIPHSTFHRVTINHGDPVFFEMSGVYERYNCPLMRTAFLGEPPEGAVTLAKAAMAALETVLATCKPGVIAEDVAAGASKQLPLDDPEIVFHHWYGYSIGIGFPPGWEDDPSARLLRGQEFALEPGMVFHIPMSLRRDAKYGFCVDETILITDTGCEVLGDFSRQLIFK